MISDQFFKTELYTQLRTNEQLGYIVGSNQTLRIRAYRFSGVLACMASPELLPDVGSPQMFIDGKPLNRSNLGEPLVQWPEANEENGTILPVALRT